jgi:hypothetical protein
MMAAFFDALIGRDRNPSGSSLPMRKLSNILRPSAYEVQSSSVQGRQVLDQPVHSSARAPASARARLGDMRIDK